MRRLLWHVSHAFDQVGHGGPQNFHHHGSGLAALIELLAPHRHPAGLSHPEEQRRGPVPHGRPRGELLRIHNVRRRGPHPDAWPTSPALIRVRSSRKWHGVSEPRWDCPEGAQGSRPHPSTSHRGSLTLPPPLLIFEVFQLRFAALDRVVFFREPLVRLRPRRFSFSDPLIMSIWLLRQICL